MRREEGKRPGWHAEGRCEECEADYTTLDRMLNHYYLFLAATLLYGACILLHDLGII